MMDHATEEEARAATTVFWDIMKCPVPDGLNPGLVLPCIRRFLDRNGYRGPLTVTAFGKLSDVPTEILRQVYSSGISLSIVTPCHLDISDLVDTNPTPANFMAISAKDAYPGFFRVLKMFGYNPLEPFPFYSFDSLDLNALEEKTGESALWDCFVCARDPPQQSFDNLIAHLSCEEHLRNFHRSMEMEARNTAPPLPVDTVKVNSPVKKSLKLTNVLPPDNRLCWEDVKRTHDTIVVWDINTCPVPPGFDARMVSLHIRHFLFKKGYFGHVKIIAIGVLTDVPEDILGKVYITGIGLHNVPYGPSDTVEFVSELFNNSGPLLNVMVISNAKIFAYPATYLPGRCNLVQHFPYDSLQWFFRPDSGALEEAQSSPPGELASFFCSVCNYRSAPNTDFLCITKHLSGTYHQPKVSNSNA
ncbi:uncharacterized protein LOC17874409 [Capsella rubella]|uniref:uncharacterized protein LOC17874409 n=1 Tax=Capsella rubella TaxID=81985 RepID=UPI000CD53833|nr:uncharacterized protein LOC17874409 [Capsella rubella]